MRQFKYDFARSVAIISVVSVHCLYFMLPQGKLSNLYFNIMQIVLFSGNAIFMLLSGKFNLKECSTDDQVRHFYYRKVSNILIPIIIVFFLRTIYNCVFLHESIATNLFIAFIKNTACGFSSTEYWFVFTLAGFLVVSPFLSVSFSNLSKFQQCVFLAIGLAWNLLQTFAINIGQNFSWGYLFSGFAFAFFIGSFIEQHFDTATKLRRLLTIGFICLCLNVVAVSIGWTYGAHDTSPLYTIFSIALYGLLLKIGEHLGESKLISLVAKHSFSIYLIHMTILMPLETVLPRSSGLSGVLMHACSTIIVFLISLLLSIVLDSAIIKPAQTAFTRIANRGDALQR